MKFKIESDKFTHFFYSMCIVMGSSSILSDYISLSLAVIIGGVFTFSLGMLKEFIDRKRGGIFSYKDLIADGIGTIVGMCIILILLGCI